MAPPVPSSGARLLLLQRLLSTATEAMAEAAAAAPAAPIAAAAADPAPVAPIAAAAADPAPAAPIAPDAADPAPAAPTAPASTAPAAADPGSRPLYCRLWALDSAGEGSVSRVLNMWVREGGALRVDDLVKHVKDLRRYKRHAHALELMDWMVFARGMNMSDSNHAIRLDLIYKVRGLEAAENYFASLPHPAKNHQTYGALLNCYCSAKMEKKATDLYHKMDKLGFCSNALSFNNLMTLYMKLGQHGKVDSLLEDMKVKNVKLNSLTSCILMTRYASSKKIDAIEELLKEMEEKGVALGWSAYSTLASIYVNAGLVEKAESALKKAEGLVGDDDWRQPFHFLMSLYASGGNLSEVNRIWDVIKAKFSKVTNKSYLVMLQSLYRLDDIDRMKQVYVDWESNYKNYYDARLANMMIRGHLKIDMTEEAESLWEKAKEKGAKFGLETCELFLDHYMGNKDMNLALNWVENMTKLPKGAGKLHKAKIHKFQKYFEEHKDADGAKRFCNCLRTLGCIDVKAYESLLHTYFAAGKKIPSLHQQIIKDDKIEICYDIRELLKTTGDKGQ